jgi:hypothetical protein
MEVNMTAKIPTWGYHPNKPAQIFELAEGEKLPKGWADTPTAFDKPEEPPPGDLKTDKSEILIK